MLLKDKAGIKARDKNEKTILHLAGATRTFFPGDDNERSSIC